jgi:DNA-binding transcriptional regulator YiaG
MTTTTTMSAEEIRAARERTGLSRAKVAGLAGVSLSFIANVEQGAVPRRSGALERLLTFLADRSDNT